MQRQKELCIEICILLRQYAKEDILGYMHAAMPTGEQTPCHLHAGDLRALVHGMHLCRSTNIRDYSAPQMCRDTRRFKSGLYQSYPWVENVLLLRVS